MGDYEFEIRDGIPDRRLGRSRSPEWDEVRKEMKKLIMGQSLVITCPDRKSALRLRSVLLCRKRNGASNIPFAGNRIVRSTILQPADVKSGFFALTVWWEEMDHDG